MTVDKIIISNFRSIVSCEIRLLKLLALVGENNAGKSNIIKALDLFLSRNKPESLDDFNDACKPIEITIKFINLSASELKNIGEEYREGNNLVIKKTYLPEGETEVYALKGGEEVSAPKGSQNVLADLLPEIYHLPAIKELSDELRMVSTTTFGKFLIQVLEAEDEDFSAVDQLLEQIKGQFESDNPQSPLNKAGCQISDILKEQFQQTGVKLIPKTLTRKDLLKNLDVLIDDGHKGSIFYKGDGLQRAFLFSVLRLWANKLNEKRPSAGKEKKALIIAIEEPELCLHPHLQKIIYSIFKTLAQQEAEEIQIVYTTHSSFLVHVEDYQYIGLVRKISTMEGTKIVQYIDEIFPQEPKKEFSLLCQFDPERNEMFFARKIILVEGDTEKMSLPIILDMIGINIVDRSISIIGCGSKNGIELFAEVINKFNQKEKLLDYIIMHDADIPWRHQQDPQKTEKEEQAKKVNKKIKQICEMARVPLYTFNPDFEQELNISLGDESKPLKARKELSNKREGDVPKNLKEFLIKHL